MPAISIFNQNFATVPKKFDVYNVVQLFVKGDYTLLFGEKSLDHGQILESYLLKNNINYNYTSNIQTDNVYPDIHSNEGEYVVVGMGAAVVDDHNSNIYFYDKSHEYNMHINNYYINKIPKYQKYNLQQLKTN